MKGAETTGRWPRAAEAQRRWLEDLVLQAPALFAVLRGPEHVFELVSPRYVRAVGRRAAADLLGLPVRRALPEVAGQGYFELLDRVYATGEPFVGAEMPIRFEHAGGGVEELYVNFVYQPTRAAGGEVDGVLCHAVDVTEQVRARRRVEVLSAELAAERDRLRLAVEATGLGTFDYYPESGELRWSDRCKALFGLPPEAAVDYEAFLAALHSEDRERAHRAVQRALDPAGDGTLDGEVRAAGPAAGAERWLAARGRSVFNGPGRAVRLVGTVLDVTARKRAEAALRESEARYRGLFDGVPVGLYRATPEGRLVDANPALVAMLGYPDRDALTVVNVADLCADPEVHGERQARLRRDGVVRGLEVRLRRRDGSTLWVRESTHTVAAPDGAVRYVEGAVEDVTESRRAALEERRRLARELHDSVTQSLYSLRLLAEAGRRRAGAGDAAGAEGYLTRLDETAQQALGEVRLLLHELRPPALEQEGLVGALEQRLELVERRAGLAAHLVVEGPLERLPAAAEEGLYRIALEALTNALKHATARAVTVSLRADGGRVELVVADDGRGFDPCEVAGRDGLGLKGMRERAARLHGALTVHAAPGAGTRVRVQLALPPSEPPGGA